MEVLAYHSFPIEVPSPTGSDDSGIGLSPNPPTGDLRACAGYNTENPLDSHFVSKSFYAGECAEGGAFNQWAYNQPGAGVDPSFLIDSQDNKNLQINLRNKDFSREIDNFLESIQDKQPIKISRKKSNGQVAKRLSNIDLNSKQM